jgi:hypothetical protein
MPDTDVGLSLLGLNRMRGSSLDRCCCQYRATIYYRKDVLRALSGHGHENKGGEDANSCQGWSREDGLKLEIGIISCFR